MEDGRLKEGLLNECASLPGNLFTIVTSLLCVVANANEAKSMATLHLHTACPRQEEMNA